MKLLKKSYITALFFLFFAIKVFVFPEVQDAQIIIGSSGTSGITCHLSVTNPSIQTLFEFTNPVKLRAEQTNFYFDGPRALTTPLTAGRYTVRLESHDTHIGFPPQFQDREWYYVRLLDNSNNVINVSGRTEDLTDTQDYRDDLVNGPSSPVVLAQNATAITAVHPEHPQPPCGGIPDCNAHSIYPVCALFEKLPEPTAIPTPTPSIDPTALGGVCPFTEDTTLPPGSVSRVIYFNNPVNISSPFIRADESYANSISAPVSFSSIPANRYKVSLFSYDHHIQDPDPTQFEERWYIRFYNGNTNNQNNLRGLSPPSSDIPENVNFKIDWYTEWLDLTGPSNRAIAAHYDYYDPSSPNSVIPVCALIEGPIVVPPPPPLNLTVNIRDITNESDKDCSPTSGVAFSTTANPPVNVLITRLSPPLSPPIAPQNINSGTYTFTNLASNYFYQVRLDNNMPPEYTQVSSDNTSPYLSGSNQTATFCISSKKAWIMTDKGDVRFSSVNNKVPAGKFGSIDFPGNNYPGVYFSSDNLTTPFSPGRVSSKEWLVDNEYSYNNSSSDRNGTLSYSFFESRTKQEGVTPVILTPPGGILNWNDITGGGVYKITGNLRIIDQPSLTLFDAVDKDRVVILVDGDVEIDSNIEINSGEGLLIIASSGDINIEDGTSILNGYFSAEENIQVLGDECSDGVTADPQLTVGGALVANAKKPFANGGAGNDGRVINFRSLCARDVDDPAVQVYVRPDFLVLLTDFYKTTYTKWEEEKP